MLNRYFRLTVGHFYLSYGILNMFVTYSSIFRTISVYIFRSGKTGSRFTVLLNNMRLMGVFDWLLCVKDYIGSTVEDPWKDGNITLNVKSIKVTIIYNLCVIDVVSNFILSFSCF